MDKPLHAFQPTQGLGKLCETCQYKVDIKTSGSILIDSLRREQIQYCMKHNTATLLKHSDEREDCDYYLVSLLKVKEKRKRKGRIFSFTGGDGIKG